MFPAPRLAAIEDDEAEIRAMFGITEDSDGQDTNVSTTESSATDENKSSETPDTNTSEGNTEKEEPEKTETETKPIKSERSTELNPEDKFMNKQANAFAQMRIQNKQLSDLVMQLAKATGQDPRDTMEASTILKESLTKVESKQRNIPEDVLREMEADKKALAEFKQNQAKQKAIEGFRQVQSLFTLTTEDVNDFADKLIENNINPFTQENVDLVKEYKNIYFDQLIAKARDAGVQEERARSLKAQNNSTTPSTQQGVTENTGSQEKPIRSVKDLDALFESLTRN